MYKVEAVLTIVFHNKFNIVHPVPVLKDPQGCVLCNFSTMEEMIVKN